MKINLTYIPYHDWRKIKQEGFRTRDAHFIQSFREDKSVEKLIILNRPITFAELFIKKKTIRKKIKGKIIYEAKNGCLYQLDNNTYLIDYFLLQNIKHLTKKRVWYFNAYGHKKVVSFYKDCLDLLEIDTSNIVSSNLFAYKFLNKVSGKKIFDGWDNFNLIPDVKSAKVEINKAYKSLALNVKQWVTNSTENQQYYIDKFNVKNVEIIKNGVKLKPFTLVLETPKDLKKIKDKGNLVAGFGGKITHLFDVDLFNFITKENKNIEFVIIGQIILKSIFSKIIFRENVHYLGDKHYDIYPSYVKNFDIGIVPYKIKDEQHGGDAIKVYEYLAAKLPVVGTRGNGLQFLENYIDISDTFEEFSYFLNNLSSKDTFYLEKIRWQHKSKELLNLFDKF
ncbi:glycosyltransferase [Polaribacter sp. MED152]|uniref:glycosyltransferase n=1 Tax=Polaribacter sp. MED152 TaxID=313598 RepID=UPI000068C805|nr:glycosyltransferase [Polaribacter sp. MED152]EAQ43171.1 hypothetical protein MED152_10615 [Polaribacter sp. MED152]